ncbi:MAG TPA: hypothetical protein VLK33_08975 [Terriglobales bacterium]|nr:hypothetical protein [Terriglobales bacterium]
MLPTLVPTLVPTVLSLLTPAPTVTPIDPLIMVTHVADAAGSYGWVIVIAALITCGLFLFVLILAAQKR